MRFVIQEAVVSGVSSVKERRWEDESSKVTK